MPPAVDCRILAEELLLVSVERVWYATASPIHSSRFFLSHIPCRGRRLCGRTAKLGWHGAGGSYSNEKRRPITCSRWRVRRKYFEPASDINRTRPNGSTDAWTRSASRRSSITYAIVSVQGRDL
jgi:hypothetical protein